MQAYLRLIAKHHEATQRERTSSNKKAMAQVKISPRFLEFGDTA
jgi:hypothetical protein